jgi:hypothetical protein
MDERLTIYNNEKFTYKTIKVKLGDTWTRIQKSSN